MESMSLLPDNNTFLGLPTPLNEFSPFSVPYLNKFSPTYCLLINNV